MLQKYQFLVFFIATLLLGCSNNDRVLTKVKISEEVNTQADVQIEAQVDVQVLLLAGQSNMAGAGNYDDLDETTKTRITAIANRVTVDGFAKMNLKPLSYYPNKRDEKFDFDKRFGPELLIGLTLAEAKPTQQYLLIKKSEGGTTLYGAWSPDWTAEKAQAVEKPEEQNIQLYNDYLTSIRQHLARLQAEGKSYKVIGLVWMQGESDADNEVSATTYESNLKRLIVKYRTDLNIPDLPVVIGQINPQSCGFEQGPAIVRRAIANVAKADDKVTMIPTKADPPYDDYPKHADNVHYNTEGLRRLGIAFGKAILLRLTN